MGVMITLIIRMVSTQVAKTIIAMAINKLLEAKTDGITKDIAETMIDAIARSKANPTTADLFNDAMLALKQA